MVWTVRPRKYMGRTMWMISAIVTVLSFILGLSVSTFWFSLLLYWTVPLALLAVEMRDKNAQVDLSDNEVTFVKCAIKEIGWFIKYHDKITIKLSEIKKAEIEYCDIGKSVIPVLSIKIDENGDNDIRVNVSMFKSKEADRLCDLLNGKQDDAIGSNNAAKLTRYTWIWFAVVGVAAIAISLFLNRTTKTGESEFDIAFVDNKTQHIITLKMMHNDTMCTPWEVVLQPMSSVTLKDDLLLSSSVPGVSEKMLSWWPRVFIKDTMYVYFDDSIMIPHCLIRDTTVTQFMPKKCFLDSEKWDKRQVLVATEHSYGGSRFNRRASSRHVYRTRLTYHFTNDDYEAAAEYYKSQKGI